MNRINTSRQTIASRQRNSNYRPDGRPAPHIFKQTILDERFDGRQVVFSIAHEVIEAGNILVTPGEHFFLIASKFQNRFYVMTRDGKSSGGAELQAKHLQVVQAYIAERRQKHAA